MLHLCIATRHCPYITQRTRSNKYSIFWCSRLSPKMSMFLQVYKRYPYRECVGYKSVKKMMIPVHFQHFSEMFLFIIFMAIFAFEKKLMCTHCEWGWVWKSACFVHLWKHWHFWMASTCNIQYAVKCLNNSHDPVVEVATTLLRGGHYNYFYLNKNNRPTLL